jgi:hypothetical protein
MIKSTKKLHLIKPHPSAPPACARAKRGHIIF